MFWRAGELAWRDMGHGQGLASERGLVACRAGGLRAGGRWRCWVARARVSEVSRRGSEAARRAL